MQCLEFRKNYNVKPANWNVMCDFNQQMAVCICAIHHRSCIIRHNINSIGNYDILILSFIVVYTKCSHYCKNEWKQYCSHLPSCCFTHNAELCFFLSLVNKEVLHIHYFVCNAVFSLSLYAFVWAFKQAWLSLVWEAFISPFFLIHFRQFPHYTSCLSNRLPRHRHISQVSCRHLQAIKYHALRWVPLCRGMSIPLDRNVLNRTTHVRVATEQGTKPQVVC